MSKSISGKGKILFHKDKDREKMMKKYPDIEFEKMNNLTFITTYKGNQEFDLKIKVGDTVIPCSFRRWAEPWKYGSKLALKPHFEDLGKKADIRISGGIQHQLFKFFRYDIDKMKKDNPKLQERIKLKDKISKLTNQQKKAINSYLIKKYSYKKWAESRSDKADPELLKEYNRLLKNPDKELEKIKKDNKQGGGSKKTFKQKQRLENKDYYKCVKKCRKIEYRTKKSIDCYKDCNRKRLKTLKSLEKEYPDEWLEFKNKYGGMGQGSFHVATRSEGSDMYNGEPSWGGGKKRTIRKSKAKSGPGVYLEYKSILESSRKFWRITKNGTKITTQYGKIGSLGNMTTKDYGSKVDHEYDKLIQSKKKKGYIEKWDFGDPNPKPPTSVEREYMKICNKAEQNKKVNPMMRSFDCPGMLDQGESELKWHTQWNKDAIKSGEFDWDKYNEHSKSRRKKK